MEFATSTKKYDTKSIKNMIEGLNETPIEDLDQFLKDNLVQHLEEHPHEHVMHYLPYMYYKEHNFRCIEPDDTRILFNNDLACPDERSPDSINFFTSLGSERSLIALEI